MKEFYVGDDSIIDVTHFKYLPVSYHVPKYTSFTTHHVISVNIS